MTHMQDFQEIATAVGNMGRPTCPRCGAGRKSLDWTGGNLIISQEYFCGTVVSDRVYKSPACQAEREMAV